MTQSRSRSEPATRQPPTAPAAGQSAGTSAGRPSGRSFEVLAMYAFVALGLPDGMIGTVWPTLRRGFGAPLGDLGIVLLVGTLGALASSSVAGLVLSRLGTRATVMLGGTAGALGAVGIIVSPAFWSFALSGTAIGVASGLLDSSVNTWVALAGRNRLLNLVHGCYGIGSTIGPLVVTGAVLLGSWRPAYGVLLGVELSLVAGWWWSGRRLEAPAGPAGASAAVAPPASVAATGGEPPLANVPGPPRTRLATAGVIALGLVVFMLYVGVEVSAGQWEPSFDRGLLHMSAGATGLATFGYWGALTAVRFALAAPRRPFAPAAIVRWGCVLALVGAALVWWRPVAVAALLGLVLIGGAFAGVFPALVVLTPARVGEELARHVIGWQIGAASMGGSIISAAFGLVFQRYGLAQFGPALVAVSGLLLAGVLALEKVRPAP